VWNERKHGGEDLKGLLLVVDIELDHVLDIHAFAAFAKLLERGIAIQQVANLLVVNFHIAAGDLVREDAASLLGLQPDTTPTEGYEGKAKGGCKRGANSPASCT
jgi:hypothetical protein